MRSGGLLGLGRTGCALLGLVLAGCGSAAPTAPTGSVRGVVTAGPTCPVERPGHPCPPRPVIGKVQARDRSGRIVATATTASDGGYSIALRPGTYTLTVDTGAPLPRCPTMTVTVGTTPVEANVSCDTGIRVAG